MAAAAVLGALVSAAGTAGGITTGYNRSSTSTLSPAQQKNQLMMMQAMYPRMQGHFSQLANLGQNSPDAYGAVSPFNTDYMGKVYGPSRQRLQGMTASIGDPAHTRSRDMTRQRFQTESRMNNNQLKTSLMMKDLGMQSESGNNALNRQLGSLGMMTDAWMMPMGKTRENYTIPDQTANSVMGGLQGLDTLYKAGQNIYDRYQLSIPVGTAGSGTSGGF